MSTSVLVALGEPFPERILERCHGQSSELDLFPMTVQPSATFVSG